MFINYKHKVFANSDHKVSYPEAASVLRRIRSVMFLNNQPHPQKTIQMISLLGIFILIKKDQKKIQQK